MAQNRKTARTKGANAVSSSKGSKTSFYLILAVAAIVGISVLSWLASRASANRLIALDPSLPPVTSAGYVIGSPDAPLELVEFGDFECPQCARFAELTEPELREQYVKTGKIRFRYIDFPLNIHPNTINASNAAACANEQGKFWEMHDLIFGTQHEWNAQVNRDPDKHFKALGTRIQGLDAAKLNECIDSRRNLPKIQAHLKMATDIGAGGTPTFVVGNNIVNFNTIAFDEIKAYLDRQLAVTQAPATKAPPATKRP